MFSSKARSLFVLFLPVLLGIGPCSSGPRTLAAIPGGILSGPVASEAVEDWSFVSEVGLCQVETRPDFPHSITVNCFNDGPELYVGCMGCEGKTWSTYVSRDSNARIKIGETVYSVTMKRVADKAEMQGPWVNRWRKTRGNDDAPPIPEGYWLFHLESR